MRRHLRICPNASSLFAHCRLCHLEALAALDYRILTSSHWYTTSRPSRADPGAHRRHHRQCFRRWFDLGFINLQPSEFGRILLAITFAQFLAQRHHLIGRLSNTFLALIYVGIPIAFIFVEPDLGMSILYLVMWFVMIFMAGLPLSHFGPWPPPASQLP